MEETSRYESVIEPSDSGLFNWKELWEYRELFYFFTWRDVKVKYKQTVLGLFWVILQPIFMVLIFTFFFNRALHLPSEGVPYSVFAFSGLVLWNFFSAGVTNAGNSMVTNSNIIKKVYFPRLIIPFSGIISAGFDMTISTGVFIVMLIGFQVPVNIFEVILLWPLAMIVTFISAIGVGCWLSALMVKYRDFRYVIPFMMQALLFLTPIIYPVTMLSHDWIKYMLALNPMYAAITIFRLPVVAAPVSTDLLLISLSSGLILFLIGVGYFKRTEKYFADLA
jgi:lipopolysaccharide transport system permease protein